MASLALAGAGWRVVSSPAIPLGSSTLDDGLHEDTQLLQAGVGAHPHPDDTDSQAVVIWRELKTVCERFIDEDSCRLNLNCEHFTQMETRRLGTSRPQ